MRPIKIILIAIGLIAGSFAQAADGPIYLFSPKHFKNSFNSELGMTFFTSFIRSPQVGTAYVFSASQAHPQPIYTYVYSLATLTYEPQFRLLEVGHSQSLSLNVPLSAGFSIIDVCTANRDAYDATSSQGLSSGQSYISRGGNDYLGIGHLEVGGLLSYNVGRNATDENIWPVGFNIAAGYTYLYGPLYVENATFVRSDYAQYMRWGHFVGRLGFQFSSFGFHYTLGLDQTTVRYSDPSSVLTQELETSVYHKFTMTLRL